MILVKNGSYGWQEKTFILQKRTEWMSQQLANLTFGFYRHPQSNIIAIKSEFIDEKVATEFGLVPDNHDATHWYKIVIMEHVTIEKLMPLLEKMKITSQLERGKN